MEELGTALAQMPINEGDKVCFNSVYDACWAVPWLLEFRTSLQAQDASKNQKSRNSEFFRIITRPLKKTRSKFKACFSMQPDASKS